MNIYKSLKKGAIIASVALLSYSCTDDIEFGGDFVDKAPGGSVSADTVFNNAEYTRQFLTGIYSLQYYGLPYNNNNNTAWSQNPYRGKLDALTDCYHLHWSSTVVYNAYYLGSLSANENGLIAFIDDKVWMAVRSCWMLMENIDRVPELTAEEKKQMIAETKCLLAARYFDLFSVFGGLPIVEATYTGSETSFNIPRATLEETVEFMVGLLDDAIPNLPWAWNGSTTATNNTNQARWTAAGAMALKAKILTFAASPLYNSDKPYYDGSSEAEQKHMVWYGNYDEARWTRALNACKDFFDKNSAEGNPYFLTQANGKTIEAYRLAYRLGYLYQGSTEILHQTRVRHYDNWSNGYYCWSNWVNLGRNSYCPTFEYMCMFPWKDGTSFDWSKDSTKVYGTGKSRNNARLFYRYDKIKRTKAAYRDPRLYENMIVNGMDATLDMSTGIASGDEYELWVGGEHVGNDVVDEKMISKFPTGFGVMKYHCGTEYQRYPLQWVYLGLDEMYLMYAECLAQTGRLAEAAEQVDIIRARVGMTVKLSSANGDVLTDKDAMIEEILRERACELGMSNNRYFDMCRYKRSDWMTKTLHGLITYRISQNERGEWGRVLKPYIGDEKNAGNTHPQDFEYEVFSIHQPTEGRALWKYENDPDNLEVRKWFLEPFPASEVLKGYGLVQNPGW